MTFNKQQEIRELCLLASRAGKDAIREIQELKLKAQIDNIYECLKQKSKGFYSLASLEAAQKSIQDWQNLKLELITIFDNNYPKQLLEIADPPILLFAKGKTSFPVKLPKMVSIVGARNSSAEGVEFAIHLAEDLSKLDICVVSGLALGIDSHAHKGALQTENILPTIAVLGGGLEKIYPATNYHLAQNIIDQGGFLLSQFEPGAKIFRSNFLNRNRLIAGLSLGTVVVQAAKRSGSLATARYAAEAGREVFAVPGFPGYKLHQGTNKLIQQGAKLVTCVEDVLEELSLELSIEESFPISLEAGEHRLLQFISEKGQVSIEDMLEGFSTINEILNLLFLLEEKKLITQDSMNNYQLSLRAKKNLHRF